MFRMVIVRNPYSRLLSTWRNKVVLCEPGFEQIYIDLLGRLPQPQSKPHIPFSEFVRYLANSDLRTGNPHWRLQTEHVFYAAMNFSCLCKLEHLGDGLRQFQLHLGLSEPLRLSEKNTSAGFRDQGLDSTMANRIYDLYRADFDTFGYDPTTWRFYEKVGTENISEDVFRDELIERNIIIAHLSAYLRQLLSARNSRRSGS